MRCGETSAKATAEEHKKQISNKWILLWISDYIDFCDIFH